MIRFWNKVLRRGPDECWEWTASAQNKGYGVVGVGRRSEGTMLAHRMAWTLTNGDIPAGLNVLHRCDNPKCCNPSHLFLGTIADNNADMAAKGRASQGERHWMRFNPEKIARGERSGQARLTRAEVRTIRGRYAAGGISQRALAASFGVCQMTVCKIVNSLTWKR